MTIKKAIAIGGLSILAFTLTLFGINHNIFKTKKPNETNAEAYITNIESTTNEDNFYTNITSYTISIDNNAKYQNANADDNWQFNYKDNLVINLTNKTITNSIKLSQIKYNNTQENIETEWQTHTEQIVAPLNPYDFYITQKKFKIENNYNLTTEIETIFRSRTTLNSYVVLRHTYNFEYTLNNSYENIENEQINEFTYFDIRNNINTISNYGNDTAENAFEIGYEEGTSGDIQTAYNQGKTDGYAEGYNDSEAFNHPIAIQPLMLNILSMPFTFISKAFDVTLWPNTPYEFNIANFIKAMIAIGAILFIIKLFTSGFSVMGNFTGKINSNIRSNKPNKTTVKTKTQKKE